MEPKIKKIPVFKGFLTEEKFEQIVAERGYVKNPVLVPPLEGIEAPEGTIFSGHLDIEKLKDLCLTHFNVKSDADEYSAKHNSKAISLVLQEDGSWKGYWQNHGKFIEVREGKPEDCLVKLLTHD